MLCLLLCSSAATPLASQKYDGINLYLYDEWYYLEILSHVKRPTFSIENRASEISLESYMSYGLGSSSSGRVVSEVLCSNVVSRGACQKIGLLTCAQCSLVKYCSGHCQRQHWAKHRMDCEHPYLSSEWQPEWVLDDREPQFSDSRSLPLSSSSDAFKNPGYPAYDCLQLNDNEGAECLKKNLKICMTAAGDIRNLVETINNLPVAYNGRLDILANNSNTLVLNRMLVVLCCLLTPGPSIDESAELATHLMYSASLPETAASYVRYCRNLIYGEDLDDGDMSFQTSLKTRGRGKLYSAQPMFSIKRPMEMLSSTYGLAYATKSMKVVFQDPFHLDDREKTLSTLEPSHRLALSRFWQTGVLAPFSMDLRPFKAPNRLMFTPQGEWIGVMGGVNPLHGWDVPAVRRSGLQRGIDPSGDILGCLFFHIKSELREFALRVKDLNINIHLVQYNSHLLSKGVSIGILPAFSDASFDRIDVGDMPDQIGIAECLADWAPLLNKKNRSACLMAHSKNWHNDSPGAVARNNPRSLEILKKKCESVPALKSKLKTFFRGAQSPSLIRLIASLDAFVDHNEAFLRYMELEEARATANSLGICLSEVHTIHPKRVGISLHFERQKLPNLSKDDFYSIWGADLALRFSEFRGTCT